MTTMETSRLLLRPWAEEDAAPLFPIFSDAEAMRYWNTPPARDVDDIKSAIARSRTAPAEFHAAWVMVLKQSGDVIGFVNYHHRDVRNKRVEIGYILARSLWRTGLMREAVSALITHCIDDLGAYRIEATVSPDNAASIAFLQHLGFTCEGGPMRARMWTSDGRSLDALMFGLLAPEWRESHS